MLCWFKCLCFLCMDPVFTTGVFYKVPRQEGIDYSPFHVQFHDISVDNWFYRKGWCLLNYIHALPSPIRMYIYTHIYIFTPYNTLEPGHLTNVSFLPKLIITLEILDHSISIGGRTIFNFAHEMDELAKSKRLMILLNALRIFYMYMKMKARKVSWWTTTLTTCLRECQSRWGN